jgi:hypothetical protein
MKKVIIILLVYIINTLEIKAQETKYNETMAKWVNMLNDSITNIQNSTKMMNAFERIAKVEKNKWLPYYYAAHCSTLTASFEKDNNLADELTTKAEGYLEIIENLSPINAETHVLKAYIAFTEIKADFTGRGIKNSNLADKELQKAIKIDENNPRAYFLLGMGLYMKAEQYGGNKAKACEYFNKAATLDKPQTDPLAPVWQRHSIELLLNLCAKNNLNNQKQ